MPEPVPTPQQQDIDALYAALDRYAHHKLDTNDILNTIGGLPILLNLLTASIQSDHTHYSIVKQCINRIAAEQPELLKQADDTIQYYTYGLNYTDEQIRTYTIDLLTSLCRTDQQWLCVRNVKLLDKMCSMLISDSSLSVITALHKLFNTIQDKPLLITRLFDHLQHLHSTTIDSKQAVNLLRVYEVLINLAVSDAAAHDQVSQQHVIDSLLSLYDKMSGDPLTRLNVVELLQTYLTQAPQSDHTNKQQQTIIEHIVSSVDMNDMMTTQLLLGPIFDVIEKIAMNAYKQNTPMEYTAATQQALTTMFASIMSQRAADDTLVAQCMGCMAAIATSYSGLQLLTGGAAAPSSSDALLYSIGPQASSSSDVLKLAALHAIATVLETHYNAPDQKQIGTIKQALFDSIGQSRRTSSMSILMPMLKLPFEEVKLKTYSVLEAVATLPFGASILVQTPGLVEYIVNRSNEVTINGQTAKYAVVTALVNNVTFDRVADESAKRKLLAYKAAGSYAQDRETRVMDPVYRPA